MVEMRGVEPLSEGSLAGLSTGVVCDLTFPHPAAHRRAAGVSSFILRVSPQSLSVLVPRVDDGGNRTRGQSGPPSRHYAAKAKSLLSVTFFPRFNVVQGPRLAYPVLDDPRRNRIIPRICLTISRFPNIVTQWDMDVNSLVVHYPQTCPAAESF